MINKKITHAVLFGVCLLWFQSIQAQNYIYNGGFEHGDSATADVSTSNPNLTTDHLYNWMRANTDCYHSPDWWRKGAPDGYNFTMVNAVGNDDAYSSSPGAASPFSYDEINPHEGYGMLGLYWNELVQQEFNVSSVVSALDNSEWSTVKLKFWIRKSNFDGLYNSKLKVLLAKDKLKYKHNNPTEFDDVNCNSNYCHDKYREYTGADYDELFEIDGNDFITLYPRGEWHLVEVDFVPPAGFSNYNWIVFDLVGESWVSSTYICHGGPSTYLFLDDVEMLVGCDDKCDRLDGPSSNPVLHSMISSDALFILDQTELKNADSIYFKVTTILGQNVYAKGSTLCINGIDHNIYWDGKNANGDPVANAYYNYILEVYNDCGLQTFSGTLGKFSDYTGSLSTNFDEPCFNGVNPTPEPCCDLAPNMYINNEVLIGPDPGWSEYILKRHIWACTAEPDFSDEVLVEDEARVLFRAGKQITLREGFNTELGAVFCAEIEPCRGRQQNRVVFNPESQVSQEREEELLGFDLFPNPSEDIVNIKLESFDETNTYTIKVVSVLGKTVYEGRLTSGNEQLDLSALKKGVYLVNISNGKEQVTQRFMKN